MPPSSAKQLTENPIADTPNKVDNYLPHQNIPTKKKTFAETLNPNPFSKKRSGQYI